MAPAIALGLIQQFGVPAAKGLYDVYQLWKDKREITPEFWDQMLAVNAIPLSKYEEGAVVIPKV